MSIGVEDYCLELGVEPSADGLDAYPVAALVTICKAVGVQPTGLVGSIAGFRDLGVFEQGAQRARQLGCEGAGCIHPDQVAVLNRVFTPDPAKVEYARRVVEAFEEACAAARRPSISTGRWSTYRSISEPRSSWCAPSEAEPSTARPRPSGKTRDARGPGDGDLARRHRHRRHLHRRRPRRR